MKSVLSIILWIFAPMLTPYGLQIGEVKTNNQTIKIMKMNFNNPAWLQGASNVGGGEPVTRFVFVEGENQLRLSSSGSVVIESVQDGETVSETYESLSDTAVTINADADTEVVIYGAVTKIKTWVIYPKSVLASLDVSKNTALTYLECRGCTELTSLDVSKNTALTYLNCSECTGIASLDVSKNTALTELTCSGCTGITSLDVSKNTALAELTCIGCTELTSLDVSKNTALTYLECSGCTELTSLDVSKNTALTFLSFSGCTGITSLDVSKNTALTYLGCDDCTGITSLDVSKNTALTELACRGCTGITSLDVSKNTALTYLECSGCTGITSLDVSKNTALTELTCSGCTGLMLLDIQNTAQLGSGDEKGDMFSGISTNLTTLQVAGTSAWAYEQVEDWLNGDAPSGGTILVDENTPQDVITAATGKSWTVEYVDAA